MPGSGTRGGSRPGRSPGAAAPNESTATATALERDIADASDRADAERSAMAELEAWRVRAIPDPAAPLDADDLARLVRECFDALGIDAEVGADFSVNTVHYYRRKDILDAPAGRTSAARYGVRHLWQAVGARLAGYLGLVTLAEAREVMRGADDWTLLAFVAARLVDARSRQALRQAAPITVPGAPPPKSAPAGRARPLPATVAALAAAPALGSSPAARSPIPRPVTAVVFRLPGEAWCIVPETHAARHSSGAARELARALAAALGVGLDVADDKP